MSTTIEISEATFARLQKYATPLIDSPDTAIMKVINLLEGAAGNAASSASKPVQPRLDPHAPPDLSHTKVTSAKVAGKALPPAQCNWNAVMLAVVRSAAAKLPKGAKLGDLIVVNHVEGRKEDSGYKFHKDLGLSIQGQDSNSAWKAIAHIAGETGVAVEVGFAWYDHPKAAGPGQSDRLSL